MKHIVKILIIVALALQSCHSQSQEQGQSMKDSFIPMEYGDCEPEIVPMGIYFENIIDFVYDPNEDMFLIEYMDSDVVDTDNIQINGEWNTLDYFQIECSKQDFFNILEEYSIWTETQKQKDLNWGFIEIVTPVEGGLNYRYNLVSL